MLHIWEVYGRDKFVLQALLEKFKGDLTDEILETLFCEVESIVNSRPLTKCDDQTKDNSSLQISY